MPTAALTSDHLLTIPFYGLFGRLCDDRHRSTGSRSIASTANRPERYINMSDIVFSAGVRSNLLQLQKTSDLITTTQTRLATGKRVNSALDNPINFFTAQGLSNRANDLSNLLELDVDGDQHDPGRQQRHHLDHQAGAVRPGARQPGAADHRHRGALQPRHPVRRPPDADRPARRRLGLQRHQPARRQRPHRHAERKRLFQRHGQPPSTHHPRAPISPSTPRPTTGPPRPTSPPRAPT